MMNYSRCAGIFLILSLVFFQTGFAKITANKDSSAVSIVPRPLYAQVNQGTFTLNAKTRIFIEPGNQDMKAIAQQFSDQMKEITGFSLPISEGNELPKNAIHFSTKAGLDTLGPEGYHLIVGPDQIHATGEPQGVFYAMQSIYQLLPAGELPQNITLPAVEIVDRPRFEWRGLMLDVGRYFYSVEFIKKYIDYLAMHKMNTFHWHLTEDHGWRLEIKKYPRLTEVGAWRAGTQFAHPGRINPHPHGGYYTQEEAREIVAYAKTKFVTVVPEIEMPGHTLAALVAYPELSCTGGPFEMPVKWGIQKDIYCAGNDKTFEFLENILTEVAEIFPSEIIHIGGDEAPKDRWKVCPKCQARIKAEGLQDEHELQSYFITRIENFLLTKNKRIIGWDEILEGGLAPNAAVMSWRGVKGGIEAAKQHHPVVMTPTDYFYFDYYQGEPYLEPYAIGGFLPLEKVYNYEPIPDEFSAEEATYIKGVQANVWGEYIHTPEMAEYMTFPRAAALAEIGWSAKADKDWPDFLRRMEKQYQRYDREGINYSHSAYNVQFETDIDSLAGKAKVTMKTNSDDPRIYYTLDGSEPDTGALEYGGEIEVDLPLTIKAATYKAGKRMSKVSHRTLVILKE